MLLSSVYGGGYDLFKYIFIVQQVMIRHHDHQIMNV